MNTGCQNRKNLQPSHRAIGEGPLKCTDRQGRMLISNVQIQKEVVIPPQFESAVTERLTAQNLCPFELVEALEEGPPIRLRPEPTHQEWTGTSLMFELLGPTSYFENRFHSRHLYGTNANGRKLPHFHSETSLTTVGQRVVPQHF